MACEWLVTRFVSRAGAVTFTEVPDTDAPAAGAVRLTVGGCASSEPPTWPRYADSGVLEKVGPTVKVAGRLVRLVCELVTFRVPLLVSRKNIVPEPAGDSVAIQYFWPAVIVVAGRATEFHAPFWGAVMVACASRVPGSLVGVLP